MRKIIIICLVAFCFQACWLEGDKNKFSLTGEIAGAGDGLVILEQFDWTKRERIVFDSTELKDGEFRFTSKGSINPDLWLVRVDSLGSFEVFLENSPIKVKAKIGDYNYKTSSYLQDINVTGSTVHNLYEKHQADVMAIRRKSEYAPYMSLVDQLNSLPQEADQTLRDSLLMEMKKQDSLSKAMNNEIHEFKTKFLFDNPSSPIAPVIYALFNFRENLLSFEEMTRIMEALSGDATNTSTYKYMKSQYDLIARMSPGAVAPNFTLNTPDGKRLSLTDTRGKYVLLDFWASWCVPCRKSSPYLKSVYAKYKDQGFEILAVSNDTNHDKWKKAISDDQTPWLHVVDTFPNKRAAAEVATLYAVQFLPTTYLLDPEGVILARNLSEEELSKKLEEIFGI